MACKANGSGCINPKKTEDAEIISDHEFRYHNAHFFQIHVPEKLGSAQAIYYDVAALKECIRIIREQKIEHPIVYIMACRIGPFMKHYYKRIHKLGGKVCLNLDGDEGVLWTRFWIARWRLKSWWGQRHVDGHTEQKTLGVWMYGRTSHIFGVMQ